MKLKDTLIIALEIVVPLCLYYMLCKIPFDFDPDLSIIKYGSFLIVPLVLYILKITFNSFYKECIKKLFEYIPRWFSSYIRQRLLKSIPNKEDCYSLFNDFDNVTINDSSDSILSLNGLVGENNKEDFSMTVTEQQIETFVNTILKQFGQINEFGKDHLFESKEQFDEFRKIFDVENIKDAITQVRKEILDRQNTFKFVSDQFGIRDISKKGKTLKVDLYRTTHFTFKVMNRLYNNHLVYLMNIAEKFCKYINKENIRKEGFIALSPFFASLGLNIILELVSKKRGECFVIQKRSSNVYGNVSRYHISVNETFSFTDIEISHSPTFKRCVLRGIEEELGVPPSKEENEYNKIKYIDLFFNPKRGNLGLSLAYRSSENPSHITYYPGTDKVVEADKHFCVYDINSYKKMKNFISLFNWIVYTPFLLQRYIICKQSILKVPQTAYLLDKMALLHIITFIVSYVTSFVILVHFHFIESSIIASVLLVPLISTFLTWGCGQCKALSKRRKIRRKNIDMASQGAFPYNKNVIMYTSSNGLKAERIILAIKNGISISKDEYSEVLEEKYNYYLEGHFKDIKETDCGYKMKEDGNSVYWENTSTKELINFWDIINVKKSEAGVRHISNNEEFPTLILMGHIVPKRIHKENTKLYVRLFDITISDREHIIYYQQNNNVVYFGENIEFKELFNIKPDRSLSTYTRKTLNEHGYNEIFGLNITDKSNGIMLYDIYKTNDKGSSSYIITANMRQNDMRQKDHKRVLKGDKEEITKSLCNIIKENEVDKNEILMLQQILIRKGIYLFIQE